MRLSLLVLCPETLDAWTPSSIFLTQGDWVYLGLPSLQHGLETVRAVSGQL